MTTNQVFSQLSPNANVISTMLSSNGNIMINILTNTNYLDDVVSIALVPIGQTLSNKHWISSNVSVVHNYGFYLQKICLGTGDNVVVLSNNGGSSFTVTGQLFS